MLYALLLLAVVLILTRVDAARLEGVRSELDQARGALRRASLQTEERDRWLEVVVRVAAGAADGEPSRWEPRAVVAVRNLRSEVMRLRQRVTSSQRAEPMVPLEIEDVRWESRGLMMNPPPSEDR